jgi:putative ABC transport system substrate-binding protein
MRRRSTIGMLLAGTTALLSRVARAQSQRMPVIGFLRAGEPPAAFMKAFHRGLQEHGYVAGQSIALEMRIGRTDQLAQLAEELVRMKVDVIVASASSAAVAAKQATASLPIVMIAVYHPVELGIVATLARPGGNVTGNAVTAGDMAGKRLQLLRDLVPTLKRIGVLSHEGHASNTVQLEATDLAARALGLGLEVVPVRSADDFEPALRSLRGVDGLLHPDTPLFNSNVRRFVDAVAGTRLPAIHPFRAYTEEGGLISYGADLPDLFHRAATTVARVLKGARPADLPVEQPTKFELVVNLKTAKALGLAVAPAILLGADDLIDER